MLQFNYRKTPGAAAALIREQGASFEPEAIAAMFRAARPSVIGRIADEAFLLDVIAVDDAAAFAVSFPNTRI